MEYNYYYNGCDYEYDYYYYDDNCDYNGSWIDFGYDAYVQIYR